ncbi:MAG TPA: class I SAM-dependent methyltransferase [Polyangiaceae bacterium]|nr:class I SAM-dependent methyltransferase [Polyangiaceae bacterium]
MTADTNSTAAFYDEMWQSWGALESGSPAASHRRRWLLKLIRQHAPRAERVLEVGCGQGALLRSLGCALPRAALSGADVSEASLAIARAACPTAEFFALDLAAPDFEQRQGARAGSFELIVCSEVLEHLTDDRSALVRLRWLLAPGGHLVVSVPAGQQTRFDRAIGHVRHYDEAMLRQRLVGAGFELDTSLAWGFPFHTLYRLVVRVAARLTLERAGGAPQPSPLLALGYRAFGSLLKPLYYLNRPYWGEQLFAVAHRSAGRGREPGA